MLELPTKGWRLPAIAAAAGFLFAASDAFAAVEQELSVAPIIGSVEGIGYDGEQAFVAGWACQPEHPESVLIFVTDQPGTRDPTRNVQGWANVDSDPVVSQACGEHESGRHRFLISLPSRLAPSAAAGKLRLFALPEAPGHTRGVELVGSGAPLRVLDKLEMTFLSPTAPAVSGTDRSLAEHPRVFTTTAELKDVVARINRSGSLSRRRFAQLALQVRQHLAATVDWDATYSGCRSELYREAFATESSVDAYREALRAAMTIAPGARPPTGAAVVASRLALYAALVKAGATPPDEPSARELTLLGLPPDAPSPEAATALAKRILLAWAERGMRDAAGRFLPLSSFSCDQRGRSFPALSNEAAGVLGEGVVHSVHARDLLLSLAALDGEEERKLDAFHGAMFDLIRQSANKGLGNLDRPCGRFSTGRAVALASLLAVAPPR